MNKHYISFLGLLLSCSLNEGDLLDISYRLKSDILRDKYFSNWYKQSKHENKQNTKLYSGRLKDAYEISMLIMNPDSIRKYVYDKFKITQEYIVLTDHIPVYSADSVSKYVSNSKEIQIQIFTKNDTLIPKLSTLLLNSDVLFNLKVLYYDSIHNMQLQNFLGKPSVFYQENHSNNDSILDQKNKLEFIKSKLNIYPEHWGKQWQLLTFPQVDAIIFDNDSSAFAELSYYYCHYIYTLEKKQTWTIKEMQERGGE